MENKILLIRILNNRMQTIILLITFYSFEALFIMLFFND